MLTLSLNLRKTKISAQIFADHILTDKRVDLKGWVISKMWN